MDIEGAGPALIDQLLCHQPAGNGTSGGEAQHNGQGATGA